MRFVYILLGAVAGFLGIASGIIVHLSILCNLQSFGVPYVGKSMFKNNKAKIDFI